tara:strand:- start:237 stop:1580 length:1344 start_codon:yes stop_codon:yes gene_type:complete
MADRLEENLGKYPYITLAQVKDYLSISSTTADARLANVINYATGMVEHYIGQEVLANDYLEIFDGGKTSVMVSRLPLSNVYQVTEFNGVEDQVLDDPSTIGRPNQSDSDDMNIVFNNNAHLNTRVKNFGTSSLEVGLNDFIESGTVPEQLKFEEGDFTIEMFIRVNESSLPVKELFSINTDSTNSLKFSTNGTSGLKIVSTISGSATTVTGANTNVQTQQFGQRHFAHVAASFNAQSQKMFLFYNGNNITGASGETFAVSNNTFTTNVRIGTDFAGYIDELRISEIARYSADFTTPTKRFRPDQDTVMLVHFDGKNNATTAEDIHNAVSEYTFSRDMGEVTRDVGSVGARGSYPTLRNNYPSLTLSGPPAFQPFPSGVKVDYRAGYESSDVPQDLQMATLDVIKLIYKQDQEKKGFSFEGERGEKYSLAGTFPPHIRRILDLYRIVQ